MWHHLTIKTASHAADGEAEPAPIRERRIGIAGIKVEGVSIRGTSRGRRRPIVANIAHEPQGAVEQVDVPATRKERRSKWQC